MVNPSCKSELEPSEVVVGVGSMDPIDRIMIFDVQSVAWLLG